MAARNSFSSSLRLGLELAPGGLCLVQDLANTDAIDAFAVPDLLADVEVAGRWATDALTTWSERTGQPRCDVSLTRRDLLPLRKLRSDVRSWLATGDPTVLTVPARAVTVAVDEGRVVYGPHGAGAAGVTALVSMELLLATQATTANRLRVCQNTDCSAAFYDKSKNGSRVWHDVKSCGNVANLRASRARRRTAGT